MHWWQQSQCNVQRASLFRRLLVSRSFHAAHSLRMNISQSTVNHPRSAFRMDEKSAAAIPYDYTPRAHRKPLLVERLDDFSGEDRFELFHVRISVPEVAEHIATARYHSDFSFETCLADLLGSPIWRARVRNQRSSYADRDTRISIGAPCLPACGPTCRSDGREKCIDRTEQL